MLVLVLVFVLQLLLLLLLLLVFVLLLLLLLVLMLVLLLLVLTLALLECSCWFWFYELRDHFFSAPSAASTHGRGLYGALCNNARGYDQLACDGKEQGAMGAGFPAIPGAANRTNAEFGCRGVPIYAGT